MSSKKKQILIFVIPHYDFFNSDNGRELIGSLLKDIENDNINNLILFPPYPHFNWFRYHQPISESELEEYLIRWKRYYIHEWEYYLNRRRLYWPEWTEWWKEIEHLLPNLLKNLRKLKEKGVIENIVILFISDSNDTEMSSIFKDNIHDLQILNVKIAQSDQVPKRQTRDKSTIYYPSERDTLFSILSSLSQFRQTEEKSILKKRKLESAERTYFKEYFSSYEMIMENEVFLGTAVPKTAFRDEEFVARFFVYTDGFRNIVHNTIREESPRAEPSFDLESSKWKQGAKVTVHFHSFDLEIQNPIQKFKWNGKYHILRFDSKVKSGINKNLIILKFDVAVEGLPLIFIRPEIKILPDQSKIQKDSSIEVTETISPKTAFASYAKSDRRTVLGRVRSVQIFTGIDVFLDCLSIKPAEEWKPKIENEIKQREIFWLFWSRKAQKSQWVEWEWRTALTHKTIRGIQPHPLESAETAPPPNELAELQFGSLYEWYITSLKKSKLNMLIDWLKRFSWKIN